LKLFNPLDDRTLGVDHETVNRAVRGEKSPPVITGSAAAAVEWQSGAAGATCHRTRYSILGLGKAVN
jgi:hypothetical protein